MGAAVFISGLLLLALAATPFLPRGIWIFDTASHFTFQTFVAACALIAAGIALRAGLPALVPGVLAVLAAGAMLLPLAVPAGKRAAAESGIKIMQVNLLRHNADPARLKDLIEKERPDIVVAAETTTPFEAVFRDLAGLYPGQKIIAKDNSSFGIALLSRFALQDAEILYPGRPDIPAITARITAAGKTFRIYALHAANPLFDMPARDRELTAVADRIAAAPDENVIVAGDLNATPWCPAFRAFVKTAGLRSARQGQGLLGTYPVRLPALLGRLPIDHILHGKGIETAESRLGPDIGSDHLPLLAELFVVND